jgi:hypothetical protein
MGGRTGEMHMRAIMQSKLTKWAASLGVVASLLAAPTRAQVVTRGTLSGTILSGVALAPATGSAVLFSAPAEGITVLQQVCFIHAGDSVCEGGIVSGSTLGTIAETDCAAAPTPNGNCLRFDPGLVLPPGETLSCLGGLFVSSGDLSPTHCTASAVVSKK